MYTATVLLTINEFVPMDGVYGKSPSINATIAPPKDTSPPPLNEPSAFSGDGQSIKIVVPPDYVGSVQITYQLPDPRYVLLGLAFKSPQGGLARVEFRTLTINRDPFASILTVTDSCSPTGDRVDYDYVILVQEAETGNIGLIDPDIETETDET